jgi:hypothetical protein
VSIRDIPTFIFLLIRCGRHGKGGAPFGQGAPVGQGPAEVFWPWPQMVRPPRQPGEAVRQGPAQTFLDQGIIAQRGLLWGKRSPGGLGGARQALFADISLETMGSYGSLSPHNPCEEVRS